MTYFFRLAIVAVVSMLVLTGCEQGQGDGADDPHAGHDHAEDEADSHAEDEVDSHAEDEVDSHAEDEAEPHAEDEHEGEAFGVIRLDDHELSEFGIKMAIAGPGVLSDATSLTGEIVLNPDRVAHVVCRAGGIGAEVRRTIGDRVEAGETLAVLESPELAESKADYLARAAQAALAATDLARAETIHANTIRLLEIVAENPDGDTLRGETSGLDIGSNRGELITTYAELRAAEAIYDRETTLLDRGISSESEYLSAESELGKALAAFQAVRDDLVFANRRELDAARRSKLVADVSLQAAERQLHALGLDEEDVDQVENESDLDLVRYEIRAPIAGRIIERHLVRGESIEAGEQVFVIADLSSVWGQLTIYQRDLAVVREGQAARVFGTHDLGIADATIDYVSPILDEHTRTTTARVVLDNVDGDWRPGMFIRAQLAASERNAAVLAPRSALLEIDGETVIFVQTEEGLERRDVQVGRQDDESVEIISGLRPGERYVASGGFALKAELNKASFEHAGHAH